MEQTEKVQRSTRLIKVVMTIVVLVQAWQIYQTDVMDLGALAGAFGALALLRGVLLSPVLLTVPMRHWSEPDVVISSASYKYFAFGVVLIIVAAF